MNCKEAKAAIDLQSRRAPSGDTIKPHLSGCPDCRHYADETNSLLSLLSAQPRVQAPADFDFRLRARIARAQAAERRPFGFFEGLWTRTFSWGQAATALAALALVATFSTYYLNHNEPSAPVANRGDLAWVAAPAPLEPIANPAQSLQAGEPKESKQTVVKFARSSKTSGAVLETAMHEARSAPVNLALNDDSTRFYNAQKRQVVSTPNRNYVHGVEGAGLAQPAVTALTF
jgi:hypothetical protein